MPRTTPVKLDLPAVSVHDAPMALAVLIPYMAARGCPVSRSTLLRWNATELAAGREPILFQPSGNRGRLYGIPARVEQVIIRSRCSDSTAGQDVA